MKDEQAPGGIFQPRRAQVRCRWRKRASQGDLAAATYIPARGGIVSHYGLLTLGGRDLVITLVGRRKTWAWNPKTMARTAAEQ
jgi:hypothetical protein